MNKLILAASLLLIAPWATMAGKVYKWVDADGRVHYESTPPPVDNFQTLDIKDPPPKSGEAQPEKPYLDDPQNQAGQQANQENLQPNREEIERKRKEVMRYNCAAARKNKMTLISFRRIEIPDGKGGKRRLTDDERAAKLKEADQQIKQFCKEG